MLRRTAAWDRFSIFRSPRAELRALRSSIAPKKGVPTRRHSEQPAKSDAAGAKSSSSQRTTQRKVRSEETPQREPQRSPVERMRLLLLVTSLTLGTASIFKKHDKVDASELHYERQPK